MGAMCAALCLGAATPALAAAPPIDVGITSATNESYSDTNSTSAAIGDMTHRTNIIAGRTDYRYRDAVMIDKADVGTNDTAGATTDTVNTFNIGGAGQAYFGLGYLDAS
jgi:hypothetical protein